MLIQKDPITYRNLNILCIRLTWRFRVIGSVHFLFQEKDNQSINRFLFYLWWYVVWNAVFLFDYIFTVKKKRNLIKFQPS